MRLVAVVVVGALVTMTALVSFLLFHTVAEVLFAVVGFGVLIMAVSLRQFLDDDFPVFVGIALGTAVLLQLVHTVDFPGLNVISGSPDTSAQMWVAARTILAASFVVAPFVLGHRLRLRTTAALYAAIAALALASVYWWGVFPSAYTVESGATRFKEVTEYIISVLFAVAILLLWRQRARVPGQAFPRLVAALVASIVAELWLSLHTGPQTWPSMVGLVFLVLSAILVYLGLVEDSLARPHAMAVANLREAKRLHERLEKGLLPTLPVRHPLVDVVTRSRPGENELELGGDFIDVLDEREGGLAVICGDVSGHGPDAAALGTMLRVSWQALVVSGARPAEVVRSLREVLVRERHDHDTFATACLAWIDPKADELRLVNVGHPLPLLIADGVSRLEVPALPPLGTVDLPIGEPTAVALPPGWSLLFYTDGLIEGRAAPGVAERFGEERLIETVARLVRAPIDEACLDRVMRAAEGAGAEPIADDVTVVVVTKRGAERATATPPAGPAILDR
jgi:serine phosphatase RsbU (regulator of sigma subunit)